MDIELVKRKLIDLKLADKVLGPYFDKYCGRKVLLLYNGESKRSINVSRAIMTYKLDRVLSPDEDVDHIDNDKTNDSSENLQILTQGENIRKMIENTKYTIDRSRKTDIPEWVSLICDNCNRKFVLSRYNFYKQRRRTGNKICCSISCGRRNKK